MKENSKTSRWFQKVEEAHRLTVEALDDVKANLGNYPLADLARVIKDVAQLEKDWMTFNFLTTHRAGECFMAMNKDSAAQPAAAQASLPL